MLGEISIGNRSDRRERLEEITRITNLAMEGKLDFREALSRRFELIEANTGHLAVLASQLKTQLSPSFVRNRELIRSLAESIYVVSSGFRECILPITPDFGIDDSHVYANEFLIDEQGNITGFDPHNILSGANGKSKLVAGLDLETPIIMIGDGYNDYEMKKSGTASHFYLFTENVERKELIPLSDGVVRNLDEFFSIWKSTAY